MSLIKEMVSNTYRPGWSNGITLTGPKDRKWGFTIYRAYYGEESDEAWKMLLHSLRHQTKLAFGAYAVGTIDEHDIDPNDIQRLRDLFVVDVRENPSLLGGIDIRELRKFVKNEKEEQIQIVERPGLRPNEILPEEVQGMADWEFDYILLADEAVLRDVAKGESIVKAVSLEWEEGCDSRWGWMRIPTGYLLDLWHHLMFNSSHTERALFFGGDEQELENLIWSGDMAADWTGRYSEIRRGLHPYVNQSSRCLS